MAPDKIDRHLADIGGFRDLCSRVGEMPFSGEDIEGIGSW
jgi:hypothetical protein